MTAGDNKKALELVLFRCRVTMSSCAFDAHSSPTKEEQISVYGLTPYRSLELAFLCTGTWRVLVEPQIAT